MRILSAIEEEIRRVVCNARPKGPLIRVAGLEAVLEKHFNGGFSHQYVSKIADKVAREGLIEADRTQIEQRMQFTRENYRMMREQLLKIVYWKDGDSNSEPRAQDWLEAASRTVMLDLALLKTEIETGMYKKPVQDLAKEIHYEPLPAEVRTVVLAARRRGGLLPAATIEQIVPAEEISESVVSHRSKQ